MDSRAQDNRSTSGFSIQMDEFIELVYAQPPFISCLPQPFNDDDPTEAEHLP